MVLEKVSPLLQASGHDVYTPTLTGLGERAHLLSPAVNLSTHIKDIVNVVFYRDLSDVVLVGHSYAGMVVAGVAEATPERLARVVYLDAVIPQDGESFFTATPPELRQRWREQAAVIHDTLVYPSPPYPWASILSGWQITRTDDVRWMEPRLSPHPLAAMEEPIALSVNRAGQVPATVILCRETKRASGAFNQRAQADAKHAQSEPNWSYGELDSCHEAMVEVPEALTEMLLTLTE